MLLVGFRGFGTARAPKREPFPASDDSLWMSGGFPAGPGRLGVSGPGQGGGGLVAVQLQPAPSFGEALRFAAVGDDHRDRDAVEAGPVRRGRCRCGSGRRPRRRRNLSGDDSNFGSIATKIPKVPQDQATAKPARKDRQKVARHDLELIESVTDESLFQNPLPGVAEEHGFQNKENGHGSDAIAGTFGQRPAPFPKRWFSGQFFHLPPHPETSNLNRTRFRMLRKRRKARCISSMPDSLRDCWDICGSRRIKAYKQLPILKQALINYRQTDKLDQLKDSA